MSLGFCYHEPLQQSRVKEESMPFSYSKTPYCRNNFVSRIGHRGHNPRHYILGSPDACIKPLKDRHFRVPLNFANLSNRDIREN